MAYIGIKPAESFTSFATQTFSTSATSSYTLDHAVTNENELALFINNVRQQPGSGKAYTATGTALTLSANTASTDTMYAVFLGRALQTVNPPAASVGASQVADDLITSAKLNYAETTLTDGATVSWDASTADVAKVTLGGNRTLAAPTNGTTGQFISLLIIQDGTGSRTLTWNAVFEFASDTAPTLTTTANLGDVFVFRYNGSKWLEVGRNQALTLS